MVRRTISKGSDWLHEFETQIDPLEDMRARHRALVDSILFKDQQAATYLQVYVTLAIAVFTASFAALSLGGSAMNAAAWGLAASGLTLFVGCLFCVRAARSSAINLPGRGADFWKWALETAVDRKAVLVAYLDSLEGKQDHNIAINEYTATQLARARGIGIAAPIVGTVVGLIAMLTISMHEASVCHLRPSECPNPSVAAAAVEAP